MEIAVLIPITAILATAWVIVTVVRARQDRKAAGAGEEHEKKNSQLTQENEALRASLRKLEERMHVLERIATDPAERTAREIESLR